MCDAVVEDISSGKIEENNCSNETNPNIIMTDSNIESITSLYFLGSRNISNISGIEYFTSLTSLRLNNNQIIDLTPLKDLTNLTNLSLENNQITDLTPLKDLTSLTYLSLYYNQISNLAPLAGLTNLEGLGLVGNPFNDIIPILLLDVDVNRGVIGENVSIATTNSEIYELPSLFLLVNNKLDLPENVAPWVNTIIEQYTPLIEWEFQNAKMNEDGKSITIQNINDPAVIAAYADIPDQGRVLAAQLTVTYKESPEPEPTPIPDDPPVPNTGKNTQESSTAILTATLCILSGIVITAIPMTRLYFKNRK